MYTYVIYLVFYLYTYMYIYIYICVRVHNVCILFYRFITSHAKQSATLTITLMYLIFRCRFIFLFPSLCYPGQFW